MAEMSIITDELVAEHGLTEDEYKTVLDIMGRVPSFTELGIFSVMWSEHCSYKSSKKWLTRFSISKRSNRLAQSRNVLASIQNDLSTKTN